jgi:hypothetical protein
MFRSVVLASCVLIAGCVGTPRASSHLQHNLSDQSPVSLAITNVTVIDPESRRVLPKHSVLVRGDRIVAVVPTRTRSRYAPSRTIDGTGRFLIPGLMDMHAHLFLPEPATPSLNLLLANGITSFREMSSDCWALAGVKTGCISDYKSLQARLRDGSIAGPDLLATTSIMVFGRAYGNVPKGAPEFLIPRTPDEARELVRYLKTREVDLIKTHDTIPKDVFVALADEAKKQGIPVGGHIPFGMGVAGVIEHGYASIEHARDLLYDCSRYGPEFRRLTSDVADRRPGAKRPEDVVRLRETVGQFDEAICAAMLKRLAGSGIYYVPTHVTREMEARATDPAYVQDPNRKYITARRMARWEKDIAETAALPAEEAAALNAFFRHGLRITGLAYAAGVPIMAGTDQNDTLIVPGFSLHRELALLAQAGIPPMDVLRSATTTPASYLKKSDLLGGISAGKEADLVLLRANPLKDIRNTAAVEAVVANGRLYDRAALNGLLVEAERVAAGESTSGGGR